MASACDSNRERSGRVNHIRPENPEVRASLFYLWPPVQIGRRCRLSRADIDNVAYPELFEYS